MVHVGPKILGDSGVPPLWDGAWLTPWKHASPPLELPYRIWSFTSPDSVVMFQRLIASLFSVHPETDDPATLWRRSSGRPRTIWLDHIYSDTGMSLTDTFFLWHKIDCSGGQSLRLQSHPYLTDWLGQTIRTSLTEFWQKNLTLASHLSRSLKVTGTDTEQSATYDFLLVIRSNHGPISCHIPFPR